MRTAQERLALLHSRADFLKKKKALALMRVLGSISCCLAVCLLTLFALFGQSGHGIAAAGYGAASLLSENAGGYVLSAVIAFALGVVVTALLHRYRGRDKPNISREEKQSR